MIHILEFLHLSEHKSCPQHASIEVDVSLRFSSFLAIHHWCSYWTKLCPHGHLRRKVGRREDRCLYLDMWLWQDLHVASVLQIDWYLSLQSQCFHQRGNMSKSAFNSQTLIVSWYRVLWKGVPNKILSFTVAFWIHACWGTYATLPQTTTSPEIFLQCISIILIAFLPISQTSNLPTM